MVARGWRSCQVALPVATALRRLHGEIHFGPYLAPRLRPRVDSASRYMTKGDLAGSWHVVFAGRLGDIHTRFQK
jgi:hypothetical protein